MRWHVGEVSPSPLTSHRIAAGKIHFDVLEAEKALCKLLIIGAACLWKFFEITARQPMKCPHCGREIGISTVALASQAFLLRARCEKCGQEFLIVEGVPMTEEQYSSRTRPRP